VPTQEWSRQWTDKDLYAKYALSESEIAFIEKIVRPMDLTSDTSDEAVPDDDE
jgi:site-specific DNA-methyltransferase (adenine-specific)